jgi:hypothetical protein
MPNEWQAAAARVQKERTRLARKARWARLRFRVARFFRRLFYCTIGLSLAGAIGYGVHSGKFQPELWKARFTVMAHENIQLSISFLQHLDSRYFSPMKPVAVAKISVPPRQTLRPAVAAAFPKYQNPAYKRMQSYRRK